MEVRGSDAESLLEIEEQRRQDEEDLYTGLVQKRGDTVNALINHRYVSLAVLAFIIGLASQNQTLIAMTGFLLTVVLFAWLWSRNTLVDIVYQRRFHHTHVFPEEKTEVEILMENRKWLPVTWAEVNDTWPSSFAPTKEGAMMEDNSDPNQGILVNAYSLRWFERIRRRFELQAQKRGFYKVGPANVSSGDPFSLFERMVTIQEKTRYLVVFPALLPIEEMGFPLHDPLGDRRVKRRLFEDLTRVIGIRDYQSHDTFRDIHWKATARTGKLQSKVYEPTRGINIVLAVNIASFEHYWRGFWPDMLEYTLSIAASIANWTAEQGYTFGLICNGAFARADQPIRVPPGSRPTQLRLVLEALAGVKYYVTAEFGRYVLSESPRLPVGATIVMITPFMSEMIESASVRLQTSGRQVVWVSLGKKKPHDIVNIPHIHMPIPQVEPDWTAGEFGQMLGMSEEEQTRRLTARQRFLQQRAGQEQEQGQGQGNDNHHGY